MSESSKKMTNLPQTRATKQRELIQKIIQEGNGHLDAHEIYRRAVEINPRISLSTVYRSLQLFKKLGLVDELHFAEEHHHYEVKPASEHYHLVCLGCGQVIEFRYSLPRHIKREVPEAKDFDITGTEVCLMGYCARCRQEKR